MVETLGLSAITGLPDILCTSRHTHVPVGGIFTTTNLKWRSFCRYLGVLPEFIIVDEMKASYIHGFISCLVPETIDLNRHFQVCRSLTYNKGCRNVD